MARMTSECHARGSAVGSAAGAGAEASAPAGVRGGGDGGVGVEVGRERDEAVEREVVHADGRAEGDGDERAGGMRRDQRGRRLAHLLLPQLSPGPPLPGRAPPPSPPLPLFLRRLRPIAMTERLRASRTRRVGARASSAPDDVRLARVDVTGGRRTARGRAEARAAARGNRGGRSTVSRVFRGIDASHIFRDERSRGGRSDERLGPEKNAPEYA